jgi:hypothetical protein
MKSNREILAELDAAEEQAMIAYIEGCGWHRYSERFWRHLDGLDAFTLSTLEAAYRAELEGRTDRLRAPGDFIGAA